MHLYYGPLALNCTRDGAVVERVKTMMLWLLKIHSSLHSVSHRSYSDCEQLLLSRQICFRTSRYRNNLAAGGQTLLLAGSLWPAGRLLPTTAIGCPIRQFSVQKCARERPRCGASSAAVFYTTVKAALRHRSEDSEQHREGVGWD